MAAVEQIARVLSSASLREALPGYLHRQRWFGGKAQPMRAVAVRDIISFDAAGTGALVLLVNVEYERAAAEMYAVPMIATSDVAEVPRIDGEAAPHLQLTDDVATVVLYDAFRHPAFIEALLAAVREGRRFHGERGELRAEPTSALAPLSPDRAQGRLMRAEQSNTSVAYDDKLILKLFRRVAEGVNPDIEIGRFLTEKTSFRHVPLLAGAMEYVSDGGVPASLGILQSFVHNQGDAWEFTLAAVDRYFEMVPRELPGGRVGDRQLLELASKPLPQSARELVGAYIPSAELLGRRTAELHLALAQGGEPAFEPEPYTARDQREFCQRAVELLRRNLALLRKATPALSGDVQRQANSILEQEPQLEKQFREFQDRPVTVVRTRIHGDYHLGQVLVSEDDFVIIDFEGEPARPLEERRRKRSPLQDVAGMLRSFHYAAYAPLLGVGNQQRALKEFDSAACAWQMWVSAAFLREYFAAAGRAAFVPRDRRETEALLNAHLLEKAVYELGYELNNRPSWVRVPLSGIAQLIGRRRAERRRRYGKVA